MKTAKAAFSKSVSWTSIGRNSTRHPILELTGGGLKRTVCQLVDCMFCAMLVCVVAAEPMFTYLKVVITILVVLVYGLGEYHEQITNKQVCYVS